MILRVLKGWGSKVCRVWNFDCMCLAICPAVVEYGITRGIILEGVGLLVVEVALRP